MAFLQKPSNFLQLIRGSFFLRRHHPNEDTMNVLRELYPNVNWKRVDFYEGLPWFTPLVAPYVTCQALPKFYSFGGFRIYLRKFDEKRAQCVADIVHEAYHVMQGMHFNRGYGLGFFRGFMIYYIALFGKYGYRQNPFEIPAYDQEFRFLSYCEKRGLHGIVPGLSSGDLKGIGDEQSLVFPKYEFRYGESILLLIASFIFCLLVSILKPFVDVIVWIVRFFVRDRDS
jgi:hypothetical protein